MNLDLFRVLTPAEESAAAELIDRERWEIQCRALGATVEQCRAYDADAARYAATTVYPNHRIIADARRAAREALTRGEPMPTNAEQAVNAMWARELARLVGGGR